MKGQKGFVLLGKRPFSGLFQRIARWRALHEERQMQASAAMKSTVVWAISKSA